jgi:hypothetical protein
LAEGVVMLVSTQEVKFLGQRYKVETHFYPEMIQRAAEAKLFENPNSAKLDCPVTGYTYIERIDG